MAQVLQLRTGYQPEQRFPRHLIVTMGKLLDESYVTPMLNSGYSTSEIQELFTASLAEACKVHRSESNQVDKFSVHLEKTASKNAPDKLQEASVEVSGSVTIFKNEQCCIEYHSEKHMFRGSDFTDKYNEPRFYSVTKRSHKKASTALKNGFTSETSMYDAIKILQSNGIRCHSYCAMN